MSKQDKTISERHTRTLRDLVKRPENKVCADCKRNDPRWASWNIGVFLCIRCSGIHRGMGTHISKVKSVDLDVWTPDQMRSIQLWGNARANLYWEAHLKPGHIPAEYKMESFIRSKYESRRWALEGPRPEDPSILEDNHEPYSEPAAPPPPTQHQQPLRAPSIREQPAQRQSHSLLSLQAPSKPSATPHTRPIAPTASNVPAQPTVTSPRDDLFSLDFHIPPATSSAALPASSAVGSKTIKNDILSLFATSPPRGIGIWEGASTNFGAVQPQSQPTGMMGSTGTGMWGSQSGWNGIQAGQASHAQPQNWNQLSPPQQQQQEQFGAFASSPAPQNTGLFASQNVWGGEGPAVGTGADLFSAPFSSAAAAHPVKKDDAFGDLWGTFK